MSRKNWSGAGYEVTGIDSSQELIALARRDLPHTDLRVQDARAIELDRRYPAAISTFDSLNHMMSLQDLRDVFAGVYKTLETGGVFVFDMNLEQAYTADLRQWSVTIHDDEVALVRGLYNFDINVATTELIWFLRAEDGNCWRHHRSIVEQRCYPKSEILDALREAGFRKIEAFDAGELGVKPGHGIRTHFCARPGLIAKAARYVILRVSDGSHKGT